MNKRKLSFLAAFLLSLPLLAAAQKNSCLECHQKLSDELKTPAVKFAQDIHGQFGLSCKDCHGGNPAQDDEDKAKDASFKGAPKRGRVPDFCGGCHSDAATMRRFNPSLRVDQLSQYWTSRHGQLLKKGDTKGAVCTDCHGVHGIQTAKFPKSSVFPWNIPQTCGRCHADKAYMAPYKIPTNQLDDYKASVHAAALWGKKDLSAPVCNSCHGNHGAFPPDAVSVAAVCSRCHPSAGELFVKSPHKKAFDDLGLGECDTCHGNHKIVPPSSAMIGTQAGAVCLQCHDRGTKGYEAAAEFRRLIDEFDAGYKATEGLLDQAERKGVEVGEARFKLLDVNTTLVTVKNLTHSLATAEIRKTAAEGETALTGVRALGEKALAEARFRRQGLALTTILCAVLALALIFKVRQRNRRSSQSQHPQA